MYLTDSHTHLIAFIVPYPSHEFARVGRLVVGRRQPARIDLPSYVLKAF